MKNDFFKHILLSGGSRQNRTEIENEMLPIAFKGNGHRLRNYRIYGSTAERKNLFDFQSWNRNIQGNRADVEIFTNSIKITAAGNDAYTTPFSSANTGYFKISVEPDTQYVLSWKSDSDNQGSAAIFLNGAVSGVRGANNAVTKSLAFTTAEDTAFITVRFGVANQGDSITYGNIQLEKGSTATEYEPYIENTSVGDLQKNGTYLVPVTVQGKNLLKNTAVSQTINGVTFTVNADKSVTMNGTAAETARIILGGIELTGNVSYKMTGCPSGGSNNTYRLDPRQTTGSVVVSFIDTGSGSVYTPAENIKINIYIYIQAGYTCNNLTFYPMIRLATVTDDTYEPCVEPQTTNIVLDEPLRKVGNDFDYVDFRGQKRCNADGTTENIFLPAIPTIDGTTIITVDTETQPSKLYVQGSIEEIETTQSVQTNSLSLRSLSSNNDTLDAINESETVQEERSDEDGYADS